MGNRLTNTTVAQGEVVRVSAFREAAYSLARIVLRTKG
jgi:hypothetical protein